jgi:hypothetical protein
VCERMRPPLQWAEQALLGARIGFSSPARLLAVGQQQRPRPRGHQINGPKGPSSTWSIWIWSRQGERGGGEGEKGSGYSYDRCKYIHLIHICIFIYFIYLTV